MKNNSSKPIAKLLGFLILLLTNTASLAINNLDNVCANRSFNNSAPQVNLGNFWDSNKSGHSWNITKSGSGNNHYLAITWFTYDQHGRPRWYIASSGQSTDYLNGVEYQLNLSRVVKTNGTQSNENIGLLKLMFAPDGDSRFIAMDWFLDASEGASIDIGNSDKSGVQCLQSFNEAVGGSPKPAPSSVFNGLWAGNMSYATEFYSSFNNSGQGGAFDKQEFEHNEYFFYATNGNPSWGFSVNITPLDTIQQIDPSGGQNISVVNSSCGYPPWEIPSGCTSSQNVGKFHRNYYEYTDPKTAEKEWRGNAWVTGSTGYSSGTGAHIENISYTNMGGNNITNSFPVNLLTAGNTGSGDPGNGDLVPETPPSIANHNLTINPSSSLVGFTSGNFSVDESGAVNYQIPVFALPGIGGLKPDMSIAYNSNSSNGIAGVGWNIAGTSSITRCLKNKEQDGIEYHQQKPITLTNEDAFCLDGQKLLLVPGTGEYGAPDSEYRTEIEGFQKITVVGIQGNGPKKFSIHLKNGEIRTYGSSSNFFTAQVVANDGSNTVVQWLINKVKDRHNNKIWFKWDTSIQGQAYLEKLEWTRVTSARNPQNTMEFQYEARTDKKHAFAKGISSSLDKRLSHVVTKRRQTPTSLLQEIRSLKLNYQYSDLTKRSLLTSVKECTNTKHNSCLKPIEFSYSGDNITNLFDESYTQNGEFTDDFLKQSSSKFIDINGDGIQEILFVKKTNNQAKFYMALHYKSGFNLSGMNCTTKPGYYDKFCNLGIIATNTRSDTDNFDEDDWYVFDYDSDGKQDLLSRKYNTGNWHVFRSNGSRVCMVGASACSSSLEINTGIKATPNTMSNLVDMTGDGLVDLLTSQLYQGGPERKIKLHRMVRNSNLGATIPYSFESTAVASFVELVSRNSLNELIPEMFPNDGSCVFNAFGGTIPCHAFLSSITVNKVKTGIADINGDGFNDAIVTYTVHFDQEICSNDGNDPQRSNQQTSGIKDVFVDETSRVIAGGSCRQKHVAAFTFNPDHDTGPAFIPLQWLGPVFHTHITPPGSPNNPILTYFGTIQDNKNAVSALDINADGLSDLVIKKERTSKSVIYKLNTGSEFGSSRTMVNNSTPSNSLDMEEVLDSIQFLDYDRDGDIDILYPKKQFNNSATRYYLRKYSGDLTTGFEAPVLTSLTNLVSGTEAGETISYFLDVNGDSHADHLWFDFRNKDQKIKFGSNKWKPNDKLVKFKSTAPNGKFSDTQITYESGYLPTVYSRLNDGIYQKDDFGIAGTWGNGSPVFDVAFPEYYVRKVSALAPTEKNTNNRADVLYHYQGLRIQGGGRGMLGFAKVSSIDMQSKMYTKTSYNQDFPYTGMPYATEKGHLTSLGTNYLSCSSSNVCSYNTCVGESCNDPIVANRAIDPISDGINQYKVVSPASTAGSVFPYVWKTIDESYELGSATSHKMSITKTSYENTTLPADFYGNVSKTIAKSCIPDAQITCYTMTKTQTDNVYAASEQDPSNWILGRLTQSTISNWRRDEDPTSNTYLGWLTNSVTTNFDYNNNNGQLISEEVQGDNYSYLKTVHQYDSYGNALKTIVCSKEITNCESSAVLVQQPLRSKIHTYKRQTYDSNWNSYPDNKYSLYGASTSTTVNATERLGSQIISRDIYGNALKVKDLYGNIFESKYGLFGELQTSKNATGGMTKSTNYWCPQFTCPTQAIMVTVTTAIGTPDKREYKDALGRTIRVQTQSMDGLWQTTNSWYDDSGRVVHVTQPHLRNSSGTPQGSIYNNYSTYDDLGRTKTASVASHTGGNATTSYYYNGLNKTVINPKSQKKLSIQDVSGKVVEVQDFNGNSLYNKVNYYYGAKSNLIKLLSEDDGGNNVVTTMTYDSYGRKRSMQDPSKGNWNYTYDAMGRIILQTDSMGQRIFNNYDMRGRKVLVLSFDEIGEQRKTSRFRYDQRGHFGQLTYSQEEINAKSDDSLLAEKVMYFDFDSYGRSISTYTRIDDGQTDGLVDDYETSTTYDQYGRVFQSFDASGYGLMMQFNNYGYQTRLYEAYPCQDQSDSSCDNYNGKNYRVYYEALAMDAYGNITNEKQHNGAIHTKRSYKPQNGTLEKICTDTSDAAATSCTSNNILQKLTFGFDTIGNLVNKRDGANYETYGYDHLNRLNLVTKKRGNIQLTNENYTYGTSGNLLNKNGKALNYNGSYGPYAVTSHDGTNFSYNSNGDMIESFGGTAPKLINYTSFSKPYFIRNKANNNTSEFFYDAYNSRFVRKDTNSGIETTTHYVGGIEMVRKKEKGSVEHIKRYIGGGLVIDMPGKFVPQNNWRYDYLLKDHIGSTHRIISINESGVVSSQKLGFNTWGQRRNESNLADIPINSVLWQLNQEIEATTHGFTGHEHLDGVGLIHMNGRIYDPTLGRFLQADPHIQDPYNSQSLNRYSYVLNNPLTLTDPSGYFSLSKFFKKWLRPILAIVVSIYLPGIGATMGLWSSSSSLLAVMVSGTVSGAISSGNLKGALIGGLTAGAFKGIGDKFAKVASKGKGVFGTGLDPGQFAGKVAMHGAVGGVSSVLQGGKFGHGFVSAGIAQAFSGQIDKIGGNNLAGSAKRIAASAILGGTSSALTGGKFANGAVTGAFSQAFNQEVHRERYTEEYKKYVIDGDSPFEFDVQFKYKAKKLLTVAVDKGGLDVSGKVKYDEIEIGLNEEGQGYWKSDSGKKIKFDFPTESAGFMLKKGFKFMSISAGMNKDAALEVSATFGIGRFRLSGKATANIIGATLGAKWLSNLTTYSQGSDFAQKRMCAADPVLCY